MRWDSNDGAPRNGESVMESQILVDHASEGHYIRMVSTILFRCGRAGHYGEITG